MQYNPGKEAEVTIPNDRYNTLYALEIIELRKVADNKGMFFYEENAIKGSSFTQLSQLPDEALERFVELYFRNAPEA